MAAPERTILLCSCEGTMPLDPTIVARGCPDSKVITVSNLCEAELAIFKARAKGGSVTVACTAQRALFEEIAEDESLAAKLAFVNVRETAGWALDAVNVAPKMAALLAAAAITRPPPPTVTFQSGGVALIYGAGQVALEAADAMKDRLDITVLLSDEANVTPPPTVSYPIRRGRITSVKGHLGAFDVSIDGLAAPRPSSRGKLIFGPTKNGARSKTDLLIDLSGNPALVTAPDLRTGYLRADPADAVAIQKVLLKASDLVGTFDKPRTIAFQGELCAHARSRKVGCTRCLDLCPAGAIQPNGDVVAIDPHICAGCGQCAAACPTGAASYAVPAVDVLLQQIRAMSGAYGLSGGTDAVLLLHDGDHGSALIDALARFGDGLPVNVIPLEVNEVTQIGLETLAGALAYGFRGVRLLTRAKPRHDIAGLLSVVETANLIVTALGYGPDAIEICATDDPDELAVKLRQPLAAVAARDAARFLPLGGKRDIMKLALREAHRAAPTPIDRINLPTGAVFGGLAIDTTGCTLCLSCVSACPVSALGDAEDRPLLSFDESLCVQCGLCVATCPENVIKLAPRIDFAAFDAGRVTVKQEDPFLCITCGTPFGVKSTIDRVTAKLKDRNWMYAGENQSRLDLIQKCDTCRIEAMTNAGFDPYASTPRPRAKTTEDYFQEREIATREAEMKAKIDKGEV
jgi:ferredoxin